MLFSWRIFVPFVNSQQDSDGSLIFHAFCTWIFGIVKNSPILSTHAEALMPGVLRIDSNIGWRIR